MSSDWKDTNSVWSDSEVQSEDSYDTPPLEDQSGQMLLHPGTDALQQDEDPVEEPPDLSLSKSEATWGVLRQLSPVFVPLLFGAITFLIILPFVQSNQAAISASGWPSGLILLAIGIILLTFAVGQAIMLYYAGSNDAFWLLGMIFGFFLFLLAGCFIIFPPMVGIILLVVLLAAGLLLLRLCIHPTPEGRVDVIQAFGKHTRTLNPGLYLLAPWERTAYQLSTKETVWTSPRQMVPMSRSEEVHYAASISYRLMPEDAHLAAFYVTNWEKALQELFVPTTQGVIGELSPDDFIAWTQAAHSPQTTHMNPASGRWDQINKLLAQRVQDQVAPWGVQINWVQIRDVAVEPHIPTPAGMNPAAGPRPINTAPRNVAASMAQVHPVKANPALNKVEQVTMEKPQPAPVKVTASIPEGTSTTPTKISRVDILTQAYEDVRSGRITDPVTIRSIAARFETLASDPEESSNITFDAARAAGTLYERAALYEKQLMANTAEEYNDTQHPDWSMRRPREDNLLAGG
jgi:SPFH domain / Band 7 family